MKIAYILFDGVTLLDFIGIYDSITRLKTMNFIPDLHWDICSTKNEINDIFGTRIFCNQVKNDLSGYDIVIFPGGYIQKLKTETNRELIDWIKTCRNVKLKVSVCTGSLLLGAAGLLTGKHATTNHLEYDALEKYCHVLHDRIVEDDDIITAGTVSASIDLGLYLCEKLAGMEAKNRIREKMGYNGPEVAVTKIRKKV
ncbi:MAG TPA: DJ-1/PfpI family protein [Puia sp.]|nr:DJ-1/PfpI family protein [Puia sp.]